ncbi:MAG: glycine--tRNA ligase subunit beta [Candidatus Omnitrophota bacterium]
MKRFLLEIITEELPASYVVPALESMKASFMKEFERFSIDNDPASIIGDLGTKNNLSFSIELAVKQKEAQEEILGPPKRIAFDDSGKFTKQALGFANKLGVRPDDLKIKNTPRGEYIVVEKKEKARNTKDILKEIIPNIIKNLHFPKTMKWDDSGVRFARPIESIVVLFGSENVSVKIGDIPQSKKPAKRNCIANISKRKEKISKEIEKCLLKLKADMAIDQALLKEVNFLVNSPKVFTGEFSKKFLELPQDVLRASMAKHQRIFPVLKKGKLINKFIAVIEDGKKRDLNAIKRNYEFILEAKLKDSLFFFVEDAKKLLIDKKTQLKDLIFQKGLGNMFEKTERLKNISLFISSEIGLEGSLKKNITRAADICKVDLVTHMVGEFPSLQGIMGSVYALKDKEKKEVSLAIRDHYLPQGADDSLPSTLEGSILALSDKMDNIVGFLGMAIKNISGSFDPYGVRRNSLGIIKILKEKSINIDLEKLLDKSIELYGDKLRVETSEFKKQVLDYLKERIEFLMDDVRPIELKKAVLACGVSDVANVFKRLEGLVSIKDEVYFSQAAKVVERTSNILKGAKKDHIPAVDTSLFKESLEEDVWKAYNSSKERIEGLIKKEKYIDSTKVYAETFYKVLHDFFDNVMVNVEDEKVRLNRLSIMKAINRLYSEKIADLAKLPQIVVK